MFLRNTSPLNTWIDSPTWFGDRRGRQQDTLYNVFGAALALRDIAIQHRCAVSDAKFMGRSNSW